MISLTAALFDSGGNLPVIVRTQQLEYDSLANIAQGRWHFDVFLLGMAIIHIGIFVGAFFWNSTGGVGGMWLAMWLLIFGAAWVTTWEPEPTSSV